jgi:FtsZ-binding cell division protein ZapB
MFYTSLIIVVCLTARCSFGKHTGELKSPVNENFVYKKSSTIAVEEIALLRQEIAGLKDRLTSLETADYAAYGNRELSTNTEEDGLGQERHEIHERGSSYHYIYYQAIVNQFHF